LCAASPATAEVGAAVSVFSDARFRGYSLSSGHPVAVVDLSYDDPSGLYGAVSASAVASSDDGIQPLGLQLSGGYAKRLPGGVTIDVGAVHSSYTHYSSRGSATSYTEIYAGASRGFLTSRVYLSPHYFGHGRKAAYGELDATVSPLRKLRLSGHVGLLVPIDYPGAHNDDRAQYDWRLGVAREVGPATLHVIATGGGPGRDYYGDRWHDRTALIFGLSWAL
jgi:uncharacterized protein (TIGR02001 family)